MNKPPMTRGHFPLTASSCGQAGHSEAGYLIFSAYMHMHVHTHIRSVRVPGCRDIMQSQDETTDLVMLCRELKNAAQLRVNVLVKQRLGIFLTIYNTYNSNQTKWAECERLRTHTHPLRAVKGMPAHKHGPDRPRRVFSYFLFV